MRFNANEFDKYSQQNHGGSYFSLKDDKETARVRFLYNTVDDIEGYSVYRVKVGDRERYVNSIRSYNDPIENDPFAAAGIISRSKMWVPLYNIDKGEVQLWERGKSFFSKLASLATRYTPLYNEVIEIERNGKKGDMKTEYQMYPIENSEFDINSIEIPDPIGTVILDKSYDEMKYYIENGEFPENKFNIRNSDKVQEPTIIRRTPENTGRRAF